MFANVATPLAAATVVVPPRVELDGFVAKARTMLAAELVTVLPNASSTATWMGGAIVAGAGATLLGSTRNASCAGAAGTMLKLALVAFVKPVALAMSV